MALTLDQRAFYIDQAVRYGVPSGFIEQFLTANPGDEHRLLEAYSSEAAGRAIVGALGANAPTAQTGYLTPGLPSGITQPTALSTGGFSTSTVGPSVGGFNLSTLLILAAMGFAVWYLLKR
ncbi:MAG TPA: hypothetical protein VJ842_14355 [Pyrinomonadaceae bacterium]|nr:hypothetical protein [Pyrinomonadaceae bacterium]